MSQNTTNTDKEFPLQGARGRILAAVKQNQPDAVALPDISALQGEPVDVVEKFTTVLTTIGGNVKKVSSYDEIAAYVKEYYSADHRVLTLIPELAGITKEVFAPSPAAHHLEDVELAVLKAHFGVAENGAVWITEELMGHRALPFITQHLAIVINANDIVPTMHQAYARIGDARQGFGTFIAGPSKTADIEQSLVIGAHGSRSMTVFLMV
ncbi:LutC/YkgG family protein [Mucilaginibacter boryungensis]|uniref:LUD domain-containing protein n=1 Tax=Mucilaginibacter boryungensis TaxID=768480 RepID=A0ABR9XJA7_9SPHI|nr:LUD domain-containing protein [Mucilaginibacter boryungensis]MBE9667295.1 LUD domain-containing protein [Mucilaginibacter boryungensis]